MPDRPIFDWLIVDLDGVIRHWDMAHFVATARELGLEPDDLRTVAFEAELLDAAMRGVLDADEWAEEIGRRAADVHGSDADAVAAGFAALGWTIDDEAVAVVRDVRAAGRAKVALFSNASTRLEADLESCGVDREFDAICNSARLGTAKPDPEAFRTVAARLGTVPARCLFVDDTPPNVVGAREAGMQAEHFTGVERLRSALEAAGLL